jgi:cation diffusion facilitator CzcD-associated flavoprotein CzcO
MDACEPDASVERTASVAKDCLQSWLLKVESIFNDQDAEAFGRLFATDGYWRDILSFTWSRPTFAGVEQIATAFRRHAVSAHAHNFRIAAREAQPRIVRRGGQPVLEGWFDFDTSVGGGAGFVRFYYDQANSDDLRVWVLLTTLHSIRGAEEKVADARPTGNKYSKIESALNWKQNREREKSYADRDPEVMIVGAGHSGLMLAARLRQMNVDVLVIERNKRIGDNWRNRYSNLTLHNEIDGNHFPYLPFPSTWPTWLPKDMLADWLESYAEFMEANVWTDTQILGATFDYSTKNWHVRLRLPDGTERQMKCKHFVAAVGVSGGKPKKPKLEGLEHFRGKVLHSCEFTSGMDWVGKKAVVVGTGNSGHDIAQDLYVSGASAVTVLQRGETIVISLEPSAKISYAIYRDSLPVEDIDLMVASIPYPLLISTYQWITKRTNQLDKGLLQRLQAVGFKTHVGEDETGFQLAYLRGAGGYYIDVGCAELIAERKIGLIQSEDTERFEAGGLRMKDGQLVACDLVVLATGFESMQETIRSMLGHAVADRVGPVWGFDQEYNMRNLWTQTVQEGFWIMGGSILEARLNSRFLALEIKASLQGLLPPKSSGRPVASSK